MTTVINKEEVIGKLLLDYEEKKRKALKMCDIAERFGVSKINDRFKMLVDGKPEEYVIAQIDTEYMSISAVHVDVVTTSGEALMSLEYMDENFTLIN